MNQAILSLLLPLCGLLVLPGIARGAEPQPSGENLAQNGPFDQPDKAGRLPEGWQGPLDTFSRMAEGGRGNSAALKYMNLDPKRYRLCTQRPAVIPGAKYRFGVWVKTEDLRGEESGATICMEWRDAQGKWLGGHYPGGIKGTKDWTRIEGVTRIPAEAAGVTLSCYVRQGMIGTAWFDDVELVRLFDPPLESIVLSPVYRGRITSDGPSEIRVAVRLNLVDCPLSADQLVARLTLADATGKPLWQREGHQWRPGPAPSTGPVAPKTAAPIAPMAMILSGPSAGLATGRYSLRVELVGPDGKVVGNEQHTIERGADDFRPAATIDAHRRLLVSGKPFFPLGMYFSSITPPDLEIYAKSKFNCLMPYGSPTREQMDLAARHGLKVIYSIKDWYYGSTYCPKPIRSAADEEPMIRQRVRQMRDHPALLGWYLNDELSQRFLPQLEAHQRWVAEEDPGHPTWAVLYQYREVSAYRNTFDCIGTDPYPIGRRPASEAAAWTAETLRQVSGSRPLWQVPQLHNWANYAKNDKDRKAGRTPSRDEVRSMAWQCIAEGATGLIFYAWYDVKRNPDVPFDVQWEYLRQIATEIDGWAPVVLSIGRPAVAIAKEATIVSATSSGSRPPWLHVLSRFYGDNLYVFAVNDGDGQGEVEFKLGLPARTVRRAGGDLLPLANGRFRDRSARLSVHVYEVGL